MGLHFDRAGGLDSFQTVATGTFLNSFSLPAGFFGMIGTNPSDPITTPTISLGGVGGGCAMRPQGPTLIQPAGGESGGGGTHFVAPLIANTTPMEFQANCDTQVARQADVSLPNIGSTGSSPIQIQFLSLESVSPIAVTYGGGPTQVFDVFVKLAPGPQPVGTMLLTRTGDFSGTYASSLPINFMLTFVNENPMGPAAVAQPTRSDTFSSTGDFIVVPEPNLMPLEVGIAGLCISVIRRRPRIKTTN